MEELMKLKSKPLEYKIHHAEAKILEFYHKMDGKVYVSFSGGKDSTVLLHLIRNILPDVVGAFADTGLEFPEIRDFVETYENIVWLKPNKNFRQVIEENGYPIISKEVASAVVGAIRNPDSVRAKKMDGTFRGTSRYDHSKYAYLMDAPFKLNDKCCDEFKKKPFKEFEKSSGMKGTYIGTRATESFLRQTSWVRYGCNVFKEGTSKSMPLSIWTDEDVNEYIKINNLKIAEPYYMGYERTGCVFCAFGAHLESYPNRFQKLQKTHPTLHEYLLRSFDAGGLGMKEPLDFIGVSYTDDQIDIFELFGELDEEQRIISLFPEIIKGETEEEYIARCINDKKIISNFKSFVKMRNKAIEIYKTKNKS